jgi:signal peptidase I
VVALLLAPFFVAAAVVYAQYQTIHVLGASMSPALNADDYLLARRATARDVRRHDIVVFTDPYDPHKDLIKRVVGLPGEHVAIAKSVLYLDDRPQTEQYVKLPWTIATDAPATTIPGGSFYVLGDNRDHSSDSRQFGPIPGNLVEAIAVEKIYPTFVAVK